MSLKRTKIYRTHSSAETEELGRELARDLKKRGAYHKHAIVIAMKGDLGAGKTTFTQGFFKGMGVRRRAQSPTFVIMRRYKVARRNIFHVDAYRLRNAKALGVLDFDRILQDPASVVLIEWAERAKEIIPKHALWLSFAHGKRENERRIIIRS